MSDILNVFLLFRLKKIQTFFLCLSSELTLGYGGKWKSIVLLVMQESFSGETLQKILDTHSF